MREVTVDVTRTLMNEIKRLTETSLDNAKAIRDRQNKDTKDGRILANAYIKEVSDIEVLLDNLARY